jgi:hypothetical protein
VAKVPPKVNTTKKAEVKVEAKRPEPQAKKVEVPEEKGKKAVPVKEKPQPSSAKPEKSPKVETAKPTESVKPKQE